MSNGSENDRFFKRDWNKQVQTLSSCWFNCMDLSSASNQSGFTKSRSNLRCKECNVIQKKLHCLEACKHLSFVGSLFRAIVERPKNASYARDFLRPKNPPKWLLAKELLCLHTLTFNEGAMSKTTWSAIGGVRPVSAVGTFTFSEVANPKWKTSAISGDVQKNIKKLGQLYAAGNSSTAGLCFWLNHFNKMSCSHTLLAIYRGSRKTAAILVAISSTDLFLQSSWTVLGVKTRSINPRAFWCSSRWPLPQGGLGCRISSTCNGNTSILYSTADFSSK